MGRGVKENPPPPPPAPAAAAAPPLSSASRFASTLQMVLSRCVLASDVAVPNICMHACVHTCVHAHTCVQACVHTCVRTRAHVAHTKSPRCEDRAAGDAPRAAEQEGVHRRPGLPHRRAQLPKGPKPSALPVSPAVALTRAPEHSSSPLPGESARAHSRAAALNFRKDAAAHPDSIPQH